MRGWVWLLTIGLCVGCDAPRGPPPPAPAPSAPSEPETLPADVVVPVTPEVIDRYLTYQERTLAVFRTTLEALGRAGKDGGVARLSVVKAQAEAEERIRREVGLSAGQVEALEQLVGDVIAKRALASELDDDPVTSQMAKLTATLPKDQKASFEKTLGDLNAQKAQMRALKDERKKYGDAAVDAVLSREAALTAQWKRSLETFAATQAAAAVKPQPKPRPKP